MHIVLVGDPEADDCLSRHLINTRDEIVSIHIPICAKSAGNVPDSDIAIDCRMISEALDSAGARKADLLVAFCSSDAANLAIARCAKSSFDIAKVVVRISNEGVRQLYRETNVADLLFSRTSELMSRIENLRTHVDAVALTEPEGLGLSHFGLGRPYRLLPSTRKPEAPMTSLSEADPGSDNSVTPKSTVSSEEQPSDSWSRSVEALRVPAFAWYWSGQLISGIGTWSQAIAQSWLVLNITRSAAALGTVTMLQFLPMLLFSLFGGVVADRVPRRKLLIITQFTLAVQAIALGVLVLLNIVTLWEIGLLAFLLGTTNAINNPTQQAFVPELVGRELVANAIALNSVQFNAARMVGGAVGGLAVSAWGISGALFFNAATFLPIVGVLLKIRPSMEEPLSERSRSSTISDLREGLSYAWRTGTIRRVIVLFGVVGLLGFNWQVAVPLIARFVLHRTVTGFGGLMGALGAGSLVASVAIARNRRASERRLVVGGVGLGAVLVALGMSRWYPVSLILMMAGGFFGIVTSVTANTRLQLLTADELRGRVMSIYVLLMGGTTPVGAFLLGQIASNFGTDVAVVTFGLVTSVTVVIIAMRRSHALEVRG